MKIDVGDFTVEYCDSGVLQVYYHHNKIHFKKSNGYECWYEYDKNNNCMYCRDSTGMEEWADIDNNGNSIHNKNSNGFEEWYYYEGNNCIHSKNSAGMESWYNSEGTKITKDKFDKLYETKTTYILRK